MMLPTIDEENQVLFNIEGDNEVCTRCHDDADASSYYIHKDFETPIMLDNVHKEYQEFFDFEGDSKQEYDAGSRSKWKGIAGIFLILFVGSVTTITAILPYPLRWLRSHCRNHFYARRELERNHSTIFGAVDTIMIDQ
jgi:hypothetical protein